MIIRRATLIDLAATAVGSGRDPADLRIEGGRVAEIGRHLPASASEEVIDASGMYLLPGLVNAHAHTAMTLLRGAAEDVREESWFNEHIWIYERNLKPEDVYWGTLLGAAEMLRAGVTWVADHYFAMEQAFRAYRQAGMRADLAWAVFGAGEGWDAQYQEALEFTLAYRQREPTITVSLGPHSPYICPPAFLRRVAEKAGELGLRMHVHVAEVERQLRRSLEQTGMTPVEVLESTGVLREGTILAHACYATDRDLERIRISGAGVAHCAKTYLKFGDLPDLLPRALEAGVPVGLGTDGPASNNALSIFETARDAALLAKCARRDPTVAPLAAVLPLVHGGGRLLGLPGYGRIEAGSLADLVLLDPRTPNLQPESDLRANLLYSLQERDVHTVIVDGRVVVREGRLLSVDLEELYARVREITARLRTRTSDRPLQRY
jgi:5-methylthioadenosine/S-adenosylhomocysteine deaminase